MRRWKETQVVDRSSGPLPIFDSRDFTSQSGILYSDVWRSLFSVIGIKRKSSWDKGDIYIYGEPSGGLCQVIHLWTREKLPEKRGLDERRKGGWGGRERLRARAERVRDVPILPGTLPRLPPSPPQTQCYPLPQVRHINHSKLPIDMIRRLPKNFTIAESTILNFSLFTKPAPKKVHFVQRKKKYLAPRIWANE